MREEYDLLEQIRAAQQSSDAADGLIRQYMPYVKSETAKFLKRIPREGHDDELNIAMFAFYESILSYRQEKGAFLRFASTGIRNRLIDYYRKEKRHQGLVSLEQPIDSEGEDSRTLMDHIDTGRDEAAERGSRAPQRRKSFTSPPSWRPSAFLSATSRTAVRDRIVPWLPAKKRWPSPSNIRNCWISWFRQKNFLSPSSARGPA